jgi:predicted  nucleic acid-binding Zn-ribbon protein
MSDNRFDAITAERDEHNAAYASQMREINALKEQRDALTEANKKQREEIDALLLERNNLEGSLQLSEEALYFAQRDANRYAVVRSHAADVTPEEMDRGADAIIAQRAHLATLAKAAP